HTPGRVRRASSRTRAYPTTGTCCQSSTQGTAARVPQVPGALGMAPLPKPKARKWIGLRHTEAGVGLRDSAIGRLLEMLVAAATGDRLSIQPDALACFDPAAHRDRPVAELCQRRNR